MLCNFILITSVIAYLSGNGYGFVFDVEVDEEIKPCPGKEKQYIDFIVDISQAELFRMSGSKLMANGTFKLLKQYSSDKAFSAKAYCECKKRGMWVKVPYTYVVPDFCATEYKETEVWYDAVKNFKGDERLCPPPIGTIFQMNEIEVQTRFNIPVRVDEGEYKCNFEVSHGKNIELCLKVFGEVHEVL